MNLIKDFKVGGKFSGQYRISSICNCVSEGGKEYARIVMEDCSGEVLGVLWEPSRYMDALWGFENGNIRIVTGRVERNYVVIEHLVRLGFEDYIFKADNEQIVEATKRIPKSVAPRPDLLDELIAFVDGISNDILRDFCHKTFENLELSEAFLCVQGSINNHHAYVGGLAEHSLEAARNAAKFRGLSAKEIDIAKVGALFHDIGKITTLSRPISQSLVLDHDLLVLELLCEPLKILDKKDPMMAHELRYLWTYKRALPRTAKPKKRSALAVQEADRSSARKNNEQAA